MKRTTFPFLHPFRGFAPVLLVPVVLAMTACQHSSTPPSSTPVQGNAASQSNPAAATSATPPTGPVAQTAPAPPPPPPPPPPPTTITLTIPVGAVVPVRLDNELSSKTSEVGQTFTGTLYEPIRVAGERVAFPKGTRVSGTVVASKSQGRFKGEGILALDLRRIGDREVKTRDFVLNAQGKGKRTAGFIGGGAGGGAIIGALAGGGKGALLGGLLGGGAGTAGAAFTGNKPVVLPAESKLRFNLSASLKVTVPK